jgi:hypothetical protein
MFGAVPLSFARVGAGTAIEWDKGMTITLEITPELRDQLERQAANRGQALEAHAAKATNLMDLFEPIRGLLSDEEIDTLFSRNPSAGRPVDLP